MAVEESITQNLLQRDWGRRIWALLSLVILFGSCAIWFYPAVVRFTRISPELFLGCVIPLVIAGPVFLGWYLAFGANSPIKRFGLVLVGHVGIISCNEVGCSILSGTLGENPIRSWLIFSVLAMSLPAVFLRSRRNVRFEKESSIDGGRIEEGERRGELVLIIVYLLLCILSAWMFCPGVMNSVDVSVVISTEIILMAVAGFFLTMLFVFWIRSRHYLRFSLLMVATVTCFVGPATSVVCFVLNAPARPPMRFLIYSREFILVETTMVTAVILLSLLILAIRLQGYVLVWPKYRPRVVQTQYELQNRPHPLD